MSTFKIDRYRQDGRTLLLSTHKSFVSSSSGVTGSVQLGTRTSKNIRDLGSYSEPSLYSDSTATSGVDRLISAISSSRQSSTDVERIANTYLNQARRLSRADQRSTIIFSPKVFSFDPADGDDVSGSRYSVKKYARRMISGSLIPTYATENQGKFFAVGNYFTHNFFTSDDVRGDTAYIFPNFDVAYPNYAVSDGLTIDLHINPRYTTTRADEEYTAGTIVHLPGCYTLSLTTGSSRGPDGLPDKFRLILSLMGSADQSPNSVDLAAENGTRAAPHALTFVSDDNSLVKNTWNHVSISWSSRTDGGTGTFWINNTEMGVFKPHTASIYPGSRPDAMIVGNRAGSTATLGRFFNTKAATEEGLLENSLYASGNPAVTFENPLNAEIHSLKVYGLSISPETRAANSQTDSSWRDPGLVFYMPPVFMHESPVRRVPITLFDKYTKTTTSPLNVDLMFGVGGRDINLENFVRDITRFGRAGSYPRLLNLTSSLPTSYASDDRNFNNIFYSDEINRKRNLSVLPNDDGSFRLSYACIASLTGAISGSFRSYGGGFDYSQIDLNGLTAAYSATTPMPKGSSRKDPGATSTPKDPGGQNYYQVQYEDQETGNLFGTLIDISTIHYGHRIKPGSFQVFEQEVTGSGGKVKITLRDDKRNGLYRADALTEHAHWNTQGLFYGNEGMGLVFTPAVPFFGKNMWDMSFDTDASAHVFTMDVVVPAAAANVSQNPTYISFPPTNEPDEVAKNFVYIDTINVHDENLNIVARATLAQPILKRPNEEFLFRLKLDY